MLIINKFHNALYTTTFLFPHILPIEQKYAILNSTHFEILLSTWKWKLLAKLIPLQWYLPYIFNLSYICIIAHDIYCFASIYSNKHVHNSYIEPLGNSFYLCSMNRMYRSFIDIFLYFFTTYCSMVFSVFILKRRIQN